MEPITNQNIHQLVKDYLANTSGFPPIESWDVSNVTNMSRLFYDARSFNQPLDSWNVSNVTNMSWMFFGAMSFNQPLDSWNVSNVTNIENMFSGASSFNQPLNWNVSKVTNMQGTFFGATSFNQPLNSWNVSNVTNMRNMFFEAFSFNQPLDSWVVSNVTNMGGMFFRARLFNQPLNSWNVSKVTNMKNMFYRATSFFQSLNSWEIRAGTDIKDMFTESKMANNRELFPRYVVEFNPNVNTVPNVNTIPNVNTVPNVNTILNVNTVHNSNVNIHIPIEVYNRLQPVPLEISNISVQPQDIGYDIIMIEDVSVTDYLNQDDSNIVFYFGNNVALLTSRDNLKLGLTDNILKYACINEDTSIIPRRTNLILDTPYVSLNGVGFTTGGLVPLAMVKTILTDPSIRAIQVPSTPVGNAESTASFQMLGPTPMAVSASHCQAGQDAAIYTMKKMNIPSATVGGRRRTRRRRKTRRTKRMKTRKMRRTKKSKINKKRRYTKRR